MLNDPVRNHNKISISLYFCDCKSSIKMYTEVEAPEWERKLFTSPLIIALKSAPNTDHTKTVFKYEPNSKDYNKLEFNPAQT